MSKLEESLSQVVDQLKSGLTAIRTGRAQAAMVEDLMVEAYGGQKMRLQELAAIATPDPHLLVIEPWDKSILPEVERALRQSELNLNPAVDETRIRLPVPPLTEERRLELVKLVKQKVEDSRQKVRDARQEAMEEVRRQEKNKEISEDEKFRLQKEVQAEVERVNREIETIGKTKEEEILKI